VPLGATLALVSGTVDLVLIGSVLGFYGLVTWLATRPLREGGTA